MTAAGFPHSGITGSTPACGSPMLFAAYHALPRLSVPRHPPCALVRLTGSLSLDPHPKHIKVNTHTSFRCSQTPTSPITRIVKRTTCGREGREGPCEDGRPVSAFDPRRDLLAAPERR
jgi:hypothetical protein